jgi:hypothetical protein
MTLTPTGGALERHSNDGGTRGRQFAARTKRAGCRYLRRNTRLSLLELVWQVRSNLVIHQLRLALN